MAIVIAILWVRDYDRPLGLLVGERRRRRHSGKWEKKKETARKPSAKDALYDHLMT